MEAWRGHADDDERPAVQVERAAERGAVPAQLALPEVVADDDLRLHRGAPALARRERAAERGAHAEDGEVVVGGDDARERARQVAAGAQGEGVQARRGHAVEQVARVLAHGEVVAVAVEVVTGVGGDEAVAHPLVHRHQPLRRLDGDARQQQGAHGTDDRRGGGDAEHEAGGSGRGDAGGAAQRAGGVAQVARELLQPAPGAPVARLLLEALHAAEGEPRAAPRELGRHAGAHQLLGLQLQVEAHLLVHVALAGAAVQQRAHAAAQAEEGGVHGGTPGGGRAGGGAQVACSTSSMAAEKWRQLACSWASWRRPAAVRV